MREELLENEETQEVDSSEERSEQLSVKDAIAEAMRIHSSAAEDDSAEVDSTEEQKSERLRAPDGKFIKAESVADTEISPSDTPIQAPVSSVNPPHSWPAESHEMFRSLPSQVQEFIAKREHERDTGVSQRLNQIAEKERSWSQIDSLVAPIAQKYGVKDNAEIVSSLVRAQTILDADPRAGLAWLASTYGIDVKDLAAVDPNQAVARPDPYLDQRLATLEQRLAQREQEIAQAQQNSILSEVTAFAKEAGQDGAPLRPHFEKVSTLMRPIVETIRQQDPNAPLRTILERAYDQAVYAHPETREAMVKAQLESEFAKRQAAAKAQAEAARKAAVSLKGSPGGPATAAPKSIKDAISLAMEMHRS